MEQREPVERGVGLSADQTNARQWRINVGETEK
jgi:hypothetical protein